jgi:peptidoglycan L-alanyl-D-glutamate endopeptidase CwlK
MNEAIKVMDFSVLCGHRDKEAQNKAFREGFSKAEYPKSKHNQIPSQAIDIAPYPVRWSDRERFVRLAGIVEGIAHSKNIKIRWGGDFSTIEDLPHIELVT